MSTITDSTRDGCETANHLVNPNMRPSGPSRDLSTHKGDPSLSCGLERSNRKKKPDHRASEALSYHTERINLVSPEKHTRELNGRKN